jgi:phage-related protein
MDGLGRSVGEGITGLVQGALGAIGSALSGMVDALGSALPGGALPVIGIAAVLVLLWLVFKR